MDSILSKLAAYLARHSDSDKDQEEIILYALRILYSVIGGFLSLIFVAALAGVLVYSLLAASTNAILRIRAGGAHASFTSSCFILGAVVFTLLGLVVDITSAFMLEKYLVLFIVPLYIITRRTLIKFAPAETPEKILGEERKKIMRIKTFKAHNCMFFILLVLSLCIRLELPVENYLSSKYIFAALLGILWETFTLTPTGYKVIGFLDKIIRKLFLLLRLSKSSSQINI